MAMQTASSTTAQTSASMAYPALPASPTLTNPDMILPDYDDAPSSPDRSQSPLMMWKTAVHSTDMQFDLGQQAFQTGPLTPTTPIIYGNGTMLSDIGEVTEVESTCPPAKSRLTPVRNHEGAVQSSPTIGYDTLIKKDGKRNRERRHSVESTSTVTTNEPNHFADFDDSVSVEDSNFEGDDEESTAQSYAEDAYVTEPPTPRAIPEPQSHFGEERYSTVLSRRAEQILANAKRRLTTMEDNLSRARTSLHSPSLSNASGSTPSPSGSRPNTATQREYDSNPPRSGYGHARIVSETIIPSGTKPDVSGEIDQRSSSALGAAGGYRQPLGNTGHDTSKNNAIWGNSLYAKSKSSLHAREYQLEPLSEDEVPERLDSSRQSMDSARHDTFLSPTFGSFSDKGLKRSASTTQMRDIKDQMKDLKGRLSSLRDQARADSLKRRSLQSLRTPSPFTYARTDPWTGAENSEETDVEDSRAPSRLQDEYTIPEDGQQEVREHDNVEFADDESLVSGYTDADEAAVTRTKLSPAEYRSSPEKPTATANVVEERVSYDSGDEMDDLKTEDGYQDRVEGPYDDMQSESGDSAYHDSLQNQVSHEDREDAFDYEHFFLHSAMGSMSRRGVRRSGSKESVGSEDSVETTRGPTISDTKPSQPSRTRKRRSSGDSASSVESFRTATEGSSSRAANVAIDERRDDMTPLPDQRGSRTSQILTKDAQTAVAKEAPAKESPKESPKEQSDPSVVRRAPGSSTMFTHRPSVSSFESTGTNRSFPLVNRPKTSTGILTPRASPDQDLKNISRTLMNQPARIVDQDNMTNGDIGSGASIDVLAKEDQILVQRLVASLGKCVLAITENGRASPESRMNRRRIETARRILEGFE